MKVIREWPSGYLRGSIPDRIASARALGQEITQEAPGTQAAGAEKAKGSAVGDDVREVRE